MPTVNLNSLDCGDWVAYTGTFPVTSEGQHILKYKSTDQAGNTETEKSMLFIIDKTAPEAVIKFDPVSKDIKVYNSEDGQEAGYVILPAKNGKVDKAGGRVMRQYTLTDGANNSTVIVLNYKKEGKEVKAEVVSLQYNGGSVLQSVGNKIGAEYAVDKEGILKELLE